MASSLSIILGSILGVFSCNWIKIPILSKAIETITFIARGIPFFVQLLIVYFVIPDFLNFNISPLTASVIALGVCSSGYVAQFIRGSINAIPIAHRESAYVLGYSMTKTLFCIVLPQAFRLALPSMNNELDALLKSTAVISSIGMLELTRIGMNLVSREMEPVPIYLFIAFIYLCMSAVLNIITKNLEKRFCYVKC
ncbi:MAG: amino acid ABC transporter permease [Parachlamydiales bacterium]|nr:amino acid ABC transporter permease [Parachlamydiales bacterium]